MQIVININEDGKISTTTQSETDNQSHSDDNFAAASGSVNDGGSAPFLPEDALTDVVMGMSVADPVQETDAPLNGGSA